MGALFGEGMETRCYPSPNSSGSSTLKLPQLPKTWNDSVKTGKQRAITFPSKARLFGQPLALKTDYILKITVEGDGDGAKLTPFLHFEGRSIAFRFFVATYSSGKGKPCLEDFMENVKTLIGPKKGWSTPDALKLRLAEIERRNNGLKTDKAVDPLAAAEEEIELERKKAGRVHSEKQRKRKRAEMEAEAESSGTTA